MLTCEECGKDLSETEALVRKDEEGKKHIICPACFQAATGVDYTTFAYRKENARQTLIAVGICLGATVYGFTEKGPLYGGLGLLLTLLVYLYSSKAR